MPCFREGERIYKMSCRLGFMGNRGSVLIIVAIVLGSLAVIILGAGVYFYNFYVFKELRLCLGEPMDTNISCSTVQDCLDEAENLQTKYNISELPKFARDKFKILSDEAVFCDGICRIKNVRGVDFKTYELKELEFCEEGEKEILIKIHGKEAIQVWDYIKDLK